MDRPVLFGSAFYVFMIHDIIWQFEIQTFILFFADFLLKCLSFPKFFSILKLSAHGVEPLCIKGR